jgi:hypothetical protein
MPIRETAKILQPQYSCGVRRTGLAQGGMTVARISHAATLLNNGKVLATGGYSDLGDGMAAAPPDSDFSLALRRRGCTPRQSGFWDESYALLHLLPAEANAPYSAIYLATGIADSLSRRNAAAAR